MSIKAIKRQLSTGIFRPRESRHNHIGDELNNERTIRVANGPTVKKGLLNIPKTSAMSQREYEDSQRPSWWRE